MTKNQAAVLLVIMFVIVFMLGVIIGQLHDVVNNQIVPPGS